MLGRGHPRLSRFNPKQKCRCILGYSSVTKRKDRRGMRRTRRGCLIVGLRKTGVMKRKTLTERACQHGGGFFVRKDRLRRGGISSTRKLRTGSVDAEIDLIKDQNLVREEGGRQRTSEETLTLRGGNLVAEKTRARKYLPDLSGKKSKNQGDL